MADQLAAAHALQDAAERIGTQLDARLAPGVSRVDTFIERRARTVRVLDSVRPTATVSGEEAGAHTRLRRGAQQFAVTVAGAGSVPYDHTLEWAASLDLTQRGDFWSSDHRDPELVTTTPDTVDEVLHDVSAELDAAPDIDQYRLTHSELRRLLACDRPGRPTELDWQTRHRVHVEVRTIDGGHGEDGLSAWSFAEVSSPDAIAGALRRAGRRARDRGTRVSCPEGRLPVVFADVTGGVLVHELVAHLLETDIITAGGTALSDRLGSRVCPVALHVVDDPCRPGGWGSFRIDDEGSPGRETGLIRDGVVRGVLADVSTPAPAGASEVGNNGRRASFEHAPLPRMSNVRVLEGSDSEPSMIADIATGIYCDGLTRGQVDPGSGRFVLGMTSGRVIRNRQLAEPVGPALLTGDVISALASIRAIGDTADDMQTVCGKAGQQVLVEMISPALLVADMEVARS